MNIFEIGKEYFTHSICDNNCKFTIKITGRTAKTVSYIYEGESRRSKIRVDASGEYIQPDHYSMAPVFRAEREVQPEAPDAVESSAAPAEESAPKKVITISQPAADDSTIILMIGQRIERDCGACYPTEYGTIVGFDDVPDTRHFRGGVYAVVRWDACPNIPQRLRLAEIHRRGWRSANGSPLGVFVAQ